MKYYICKTTECLEFFLIIFEKNCIYRIDVKYTYSCNLKIIHIHTHTENITTRKVTYPSSHTVTLCVWGENTKELPY